MSTYLTQRQVDQLLRPINPSRVGKDGKGFSHVEAYEIRAHLNRVFGFARWSEEVIEQVLVFEASDERTSKTSGKPYTAWTVCYRARVRLTVCATDGTALAVYTEGATGEAANQPQRGDAHDLALKTSASQALKRCASNMGDNWGLSLYAKGSLAPLVKGTLHYPYAPTNDTGAKDAAPVDAHLTEPLPAEGQAGDPEQEARAATIAGLRTKLATATGGK